MIENQRGMTLIELLASVVIIGIIVVSIIELSGSSLLARTRTGVQREAQMNAEEILNELKAYLNTQYSADRPTEAQLLAALTRAEFNPSLENGKYTVQSTQAVYGSNPPAVSGNHFTLGTSYLIGDTANKVRTVYVIVRWN